MSSKSEKKPKKTPEQKAARKRMQELRNHIKEAADRVKQWDYTVDEALEDVVKLLYYVNDYDEVAVRKVLERLFTAGKTFYTKQDFERYQREEKERQKLRAECVLSHDNCHPGYH